MIAYDGAAMTRYMQKVAEAELAGERSTVSFGPHTALVVIGALQLAIRHPEVTDHMREQLGRVIEGFRPWFAGTLGELIIDLGNDPEQDL